MNEKPKSEKSDIIVGESPDYYGVVLITDPHLAERNVMILSPEAALCLCGILRKPSAVVTLAVELQKAAESQLRKGRQACESREVNMLALSVQREKPSRLDS